MYQNSLIRWIDCSINEWNISGTIGAGRPSHDPISLEKLHNMAQEANHESRASPIDMEEITLEEITVELWQEVSGFHGCFYWE